MDIATKLTDLTTDLRACRQAITEKGGTISANAGFAEVADKILDISTGSNIGTVTDDTTSAIKQVPINSVNHCFVKSIGGMTYKCNNLIPFPYYDNKGVGHTYTEGGVTFTVNVDRSITIDTNGGTSRGVSFLLANYLDLPSGNYTITAYCVGGTWTGNDTNSPYVSGTGLGGRTYPISTRPTATISTKPVWYSINVPSGAVVDNVTLKVMLNQGSTALPYEDYYEGLQDNKVVAIKSYGANRFNIDGTKKIPESLTTFEKISESSFKIGVRSSVGAGLFYAVDFKNIECRGAKAAKFSCIVNPIGRITKGRCIISVYDKNNNRVAVSGMNPMLGKSTVSLDIPSTASYIDVQLYAVSNEACDAGDGVEYSDVMLVFDTNFDIPYKPYHDPITYPIPEAVQGTGKGVEGASDTMDFENGKKITRVGSVLLRNVFTSVTGYNPQYGFYSYAFQNKFLHNMLLCDGYTTTDYTSLYAGKTDRCIAGKYDNTAILISDSRYTDAASFVASLSDEKLYYALPEPTEESLSVGFGLLPVEGGGSLEIITDNGGLVPTSIIYQTIL